MGSLFFPDSRKKCVTSCISTPSVVPSTKPTLILHVKTMQNNTSTQTLESRTSCDKVKRSEDIDPAARKQSIDMDLLNSYLNA